jgi:hypothetical protein
MEQLIRFSGRRTSRHETILKVKGVTRWSCRSLRRRFGITSVQGTVSTGPVSRTLPAMSTRGRTCGRGHGGGAGAQRTTSCRPL